MTPAKTDDTATRLRKLNRCIRCDCRSCRSGYENHEHICTHGPGCVKPLEKRLRAAIALAAQAAAVIDASRAAAEVRIRKLKEVLRPFVNLRDQYPESVKVINKFTDDLTPISVTVTKAQMREAIAELAGERSEDRL